MSDTLTFPGPKRLAGIVTKSTEGGLNNEHGDPGQLYVAVFDDDPRLEDHFVEALDCGILTLDGYPAQSSVVPNPEKYNIEDDVLAANWTGNGDCKAEYLSHYSALRYETTQSDWESSSRNVGACTANSAGSVIKPCTLETTMGLSSQAVVTQTSKRGTDWKQMLLGEGSIVGGSTFVAWFLGIYIV
ncbi:hypothetical protein B0A49_00233 [Cryomyces minteri]|uniref:Uncharacterized protein n=1 Tax=Cryomyces minteri TaxID=331657 RepID=A0A4U0XNE6_9PEZI|nr:hypothetical protein B0A49_07616 [Cryomyces minteri]TKA77876.1 hypothetical protein B0A49_01854 [Cryomyces minteri]TKA82080.1 hypothetical protein B0A49_00233 [Cryomyces minteri]